MQNSGFRHYVVLAACVCAAACSPRLTQISNSGQGAYDTALTPFGDGFAMAWYDMRDGNGEIYMRLLDAKGWPAGPERRLTNSPDDSYEASIDRLGDGIVVGWYDQSEQGQQTARLGLWSRDGANRWVHTFDSDTRNPVVRTVASGIFCAWVQMEEDGHEAVFAGWWDEQGRPKAAPIRLGPASKTTWNLNAALDEHGTAWVVFDAEVSTRASEVYVAKADASARAIRLTKDDGAPSTYPDLSIGAGGRIALSWQDERDGNVEVYLLTAMLSDLSGEIDGRSRRVTNTPGESIGAYLAWNGDRIGLSWSDKTPGQHEVYFATFDRTGMSREPARRLTGNTTWSLVPAIRSHGDGFALAWNEYQPQTVEIHVGSSEVFFLSVP
jgi:hypothetical protein